MSDRPTTRRDALIGGALAATTAAGWVLTPRRRMTLIARGQLAATIPDTVGHWRHDGEGGLVMPPDDEGQASALYDDVVGRGYSAGGAAVVMLLVAYAGEQGGLLQVHRPEACYPVAGFTLREGPGATVPLGDGRSIAARTMTATAGNRIEQILYWTRIGDTFPDSEKDQRAAVRAANLTGVIPDGVLVRLSVIDARRDAAVAMLDRFAVELVAAASPVGRRLLVGQPR